MTDAVMDRRDFLAAAAALWFAGPFLPRPSDLDETRMYGLMGKMLAVEGRRDDLAAILLEGIPGMPGCLSYIVARDADDENALWITEVWESEAHHRESLALPSVQAAIQAGRPLIAGFGERFVTEPLGGHGLAAGGEATGGAGAGNAPRTTSE